MQTLAPANSKLTFEFMPCNCSNWDDESPCQIHKEKKLPRSEEVCHLVIVVRVYRRLSNRKWYYTVSRDAIQVFVSEDFDTKEQATPKGL